MVLLASVIDIERFAPKLVFLKELVSFKVPHFGKWGTQPDLGHLTCSLPMDAPWSSSTISVWQRPGHLSSLSFGFRYLNNRKMVSFLQDRGKIVMIGSVWVAGGGFSLAQLFRARSWLRKVPSGVYYRKPREYHQPAGEPRGGVLILKSSTNSFNKYLGVVTSSHYRASESVLQNRFTSGNGGENSGMSSALNKLSRLVRVYWNTTKACDRYRLHLVKSRFASKGKNTNF